jgi:hypothetical protein
MCGSHVRSRTASECSPLPEPIGIYTLSCRPLGLPLHVCVAFLTMRAVAD